MNELGMNELGMNELEMNELGINELGMNELIVNFQTKVEKWKMLKVLGNSILFENMKKCNCL